jgi:hypothetical protein
MSEEMNTEAVETAASEIPADEIIIETVKVKKLKVATLEDGSVQIGGVDGTEAIEIEVAKANLETFTSTGWEVVPTEEVAA